MSRPATAPTPALDGRLAPLRYLMAHNSGAIGLAPCRYFFNGLLVSLKTTFENDSGRSNRLVDLQVLIVDRIVSELDRVELFEPVLNVRHDIGVEARRDVEQRSGFV